MSQESKRAGNGENEGVGNGEPDDARPINLRDLERISTQWSQLDDANVFVLRYSAPIESYLRYLLRNEEESKDVLQAFLLKVLQTGFQRASPDKGRFRHYLIRAVHNAATTHLRQRQRRRTTNVDDVAEIVAERTDEVERQWTQEWHNCLMDRVWQRLQHLERSRDRNLGHSVLRATLQTPDADSQTLAETVSQQLGIPLSAAGFRKQLSRARRKMAEILIEEVAETLESPTPENVRDELIETGLMGYIEAYWPSEDGGIAASPTRG